MSLEWYDILGRNLAAIAITTPVLAEALWSVKPASVEYRDTDDGVPSAVYNGRQLTSLKRPLAEAGRIADSVDIVENAMCLSLGFGMGYAAAEVARRLGKSGAVVVFEPDVPLLRSVLETVDHSQWIAANNVGFVTDPTNPTDVTNALAGGQILIAIGVATFALPADRVRLGHRCQQFLETASGPISLSRMMIVSNFQLARISMQNELMNVGDYATCHGVSDFHGWFNKPESHGPVSERPEWVDLLRPSESGTLAPTPQDAVNSAARG